MRRLGKRERQLIRIIIALVVVILLGLVLLFSLNKKEKTVIAVDGAFGTGTGLTGLVQEDEYDRRIADALTELLKKDSAFEVIETTQGSPKERAEQIKGADLLISMRQSFSMDPSVSGMRIAVDDSSDEKGIAYAKALAARCEEAGHSVSVGYDLYRTIREGVQQEHFVPLGDTEDYGEETISLFEESEVNGVAFFAMYLSNEEDVARFTEEEGIQEAAQLCYSALKDMYE